MHITGNLQQPLLFGALKVLYQELVHSVGRASTPSPGGLLAQLNLQTIQQISRFLLYIIAFKPGKTYSMKLILCRVH
jgi:hypothetical protein